MLLGSFPFGFIQCFITRIPSFRTDTLTNHSLLGWFYPPLYIEGAPFLLVSFNVCLAQTNRKHVVYFETDKYNVLETEQNRLLLFIQELERKEITDLRHYIRY